VTVLTLTAKISFHCTRLIESPWLYFDVLTACPQALAARLTRGLCEERPGLPQAGHSQPHRRAQLSPSAKMGAPGEGRGGNRAGKGPKAAETEEEEAQEGAAAEAARGRRRRRRAGEAARD